MNERKLDAGARRWFREPWPWLLMLGPFVVIVAGIVTAYLAVRSNDGLVEDDYYKQGLAVNQRTARDQRSVDLAIEAELVLGGDGDRIRVLLRANEQARMPAEVVLRITHPTRPGFDQKLVLRGEGGGVYAGALTPMRGRWHVALEDDRQEWRLLGEWVMERGPLLRLKALEAAAASGVRTSDNGGR